MSFPFAQKKLPFCAKAAFPSFWIPRDEKYISIFKIRYTKTCAWGGLALILPITYRSRDGYPRVPHPAPGANYRNTVGDRSRLAVGTKLDHGIPRLDQRSVSFRGPPILASMTAGPGWGTPSQAVVMGYFSRWWAISDCLFLNILLCQ